jgi:hypothetical protein
MSLSKHVKAMNISPAFLLNSFLKLLSIATKSLNLKEEARIARKAKTRSETINTRHEDIKDA